MNGRWLLSMMVLLLCACTEVVVEADLHAGRYIKLDATGQALDETAENWHCLLDTQTQRVWEVKQRDEGLHHTTWTYTWSTQAYPQRDLQGSCNTRHVKPCNTEAHVRAVQEKKLCGFSNWRLPSLEELQTLIDTSRRDFPPLACPCRTGPTQAASYWTRDFSPAQKQVATLNFKDGRTVLAHPDNFLFLRLVASPGSLR